MESKFQVFINRRNKKYKYMSVFAREDRERENTKLGRQGVGEVGRV